MQDTGCSIKVKASIGMDKGQGQAQEPRGGSDIVRTDPPLCTGPFFAALSQMTGRRSDRTAKRP
jgi:hypothetical protein